MVNNMTGKFYLHATNVHQGGGKALLEALIGASGFREGCLLLDARMSTSVAMPVGAQLIQVRPTVLHRLQAEWWLGRHVRAGDTVLCFGNLPPLFKLGGRTIVFVQNKYLLQASNLAGFPWKTRLRLTVERLWFKTKACNTDHFVVQTPAMRVALESLLKNSDVPISLLPFVQRPQGYQRDCVSKDAKSGKDYDFVYVASGEPHKNHRRLIEAWCLLAKEGLFPSLALTLDERGFADLCRWIGEQKNSCNLHIENLGVLPHDQVMQLYGRVGALVYPSTFESFGLPLIEARQAGLPVVASESDYVRDVLDPEQVFDPGSALSIARAVKRFIGVMEAPLPLLDAKAFMENILGKAK